MASVLDAGIAARVLTEIPGAPDGLRFTHALIRDKLPGRDQGPRAAIQRAWNLARSAPAVTCARDDPPGEWRLNSRRESGGCHVIAAHVPVQAQAGPAAIVTAVREVPGVWETASVAGPGDVIFWAGTRDAGQPARLVISRARAPGGGTRAGGCPVVDR